MCQKYIHFYVFLKIIIPGTLCLMRTRIESSCIRVSTFIVIDFSITMDRFVSLSEIYILFLCSLNRLSWSLLISHFIYINLQKAWLWSSTWKRTKKMFAHLQKPKEPMTYYPRSIKIVSIKMLVCPLNSLFNKNL